MRLAVLLLMLPWSAAVQGGPVPASKPRLIIESEGSFFVGGVPKVANQAPPGTLTDLQEITIGQMYVEYQVPAVMRSAWPVIMVHRSSHTGACFESTPDGREGWYPYFVRQGMVVFVVDQSGRGRPGFDESALTEPSKARPDSEGPSTTGQLPHLYRITHNSAWTLFFGYLWPAGSSILNGRLLAHADEIAKPKHAAPLSFPIQAIDPELETRVGAIGPTPIGPSEHFALEYYKRLVPNIEITLPGSICERYEPHDVTPERTWTPKNLALLIERLGGAIVITHSQSGIIGLHTARLLQKRGYGDLLKALVSLEGSCSLTSAGLTHAAFDAILYLVLQAHYDYEPIRRGCLSTIEAIVRRRATGLGKAKAAY